MGLDGGVFRAGLENRWIASKPSSIAIKHSSYKFKTLPLSFPSLVNLRGLRAPDSTRVHVPATRLNQSAFLCCSACREVREYCGLNDIYQLRAFV